MHSEGEEELGSMKVSPLSSNRRGGSAIVHLSLQLVYVSSRSPLQFKKSNLGEPPISSGNSSHGSMNQYDGWGNKTICHSIITPVRLSSRDRVHF